jgi:outer membrane protein assembly factor BamB
MTANVMERNWVVVSVVVGMLCTAATVCGEAGADGRIGFRGDGTGSFPDANPPVKWSATENVIWKTPMPGRSNSAPIVVGDRIFTCSEPGTLLCVSSTEGKILWSDTVTYFDYVPEDDPEAAAIIAKVNAGKTEQEKEAIKESLKKDILRCD